MGSLFCVADGISVGQSNDGSDGSGAHGGDATMSFDMNDDETESTSVEMVVDDCWVRLNSTQFI